MTATSSLISSPLRDLEALGQSVWLDNLRRALLTSGELERMVREDGLSGLTSNPSIFEKAIAGSTDYDDALAELRGSPSADPMDVYEALAVADLRAAADVFRSTYEDTGSDDGYVSMEVSPDLAHDTAGTVAQARRLWRAVDRPNLMIKVPGTDEGIPAICELIADGVNVNITLLFSNAVYERVVEAYLAGLERRLAGGGDISGVASVASFFVSRVDSAVDPLVSDRLRGRVGIANARVAYARSRELFSGTRWDALSAHGAHVQKLLWASTSTKDAAYPELLYVESLIGPGTVDTIPPATYEAFKAHGTARTTLTGDSGEARMLLDSLAAEGVDLDEVAAKLLGEGLTRFERDLGELLASIERSIRPRPRADSPAFRYSLPGALEAQVDASLREWDAGKKVARLWAHDATLWTGDDEADRLGWLGMAIDQRTHPHRFDALVDDVRDAGFEDAVLLRAGGSSACPRIPSPAPAAERAGLPRLHVLDSADPRKVKALEHELDLARTLFFVSSKSGTALVPNILAAHFRARLAELLGPERAAQRLAAITDPGSDLERLAERDGWRAVFHGRPSIAEHYSALSDSGLIPAAACGADVTTVLDDAERMSHACSPCVPTADNPGLRLGAIIGACAGAGRDKLTLVTSPGVRDLGAWIEQLLAASTGGRGQYLTPLDGEPLGAPDAYGSDRLFVRLRLPSEHDDAQDAQLTALEQSGHPVVRIDVAPPFALGGELFRWMFAAAVAAAIIGVNPFGGPELQHAELAARELLDVCEETGSLPALPPFETVDGFALIADERNARELGEAAGRARSLEAYLAALLAGVEPGDYVALPVYVPATPENERLLTDIRVLIRDHLHAAAGTFSTSARGAGALLQITCRDTVDLPVPGHAHTFATVAEAQARGDFDALARGGGRALRIDVGEDAAAGLTALRDALTRVVQDVPPNRVERED